MKLSIIPVDGTVVENGKGYTRLVWEGTPANVHALQWDNHVGWIEYTDGQHNQDITALPQWALNAAAAWYEADNPPPTPVVPPTAEQNAAIATGKLFETDWVENPSVRDPNNDPYLFNAAEFDEYRLWLRRVAVSPIEGDLPWPIKPTADWR